MINKLSTVMLAAPSQILPVVETFHSLQGEGVWTGSSAFFIRLAGCDVGCSWCDTKVSWNPKRHPQYAVPHLVQQAQQSQPHMVVITGGEPLMHDLTALTHNLRQAGLRVHLETSGAHPFSGTFDWVSLSPKRFKPPHDSVYPHVSELKVVIAHADDLTWAEAEAAKVAPETLKVLQPEWNSPESSQLIFDYILQHSDWRLSLQTHKFLGVR
ncbi:MAG: 7-carboxy-7-deazaguanine synthase QueE [Cyanobacteria bacterium J06632_22]